MRRVLSLIFISLGAVTIANCQTSDAVPSLPDLHKTQAATLAPNYGCRSDEEFRQGYKETALYLSEHSKHNDPELLFNGTCKSEDYFSVSFSGDDMSLIADLGTTPADSFTTQKVFNPENVHKSSAYTKFSRTAKVEPNHTYAVLMNTSDHRGLFVFHVVEYAPNERVRIEYDVKSYQVYNKGWAMSPGFDWGK
jgi:hypothetical protein